MKVYKDKLEDSFPVFIFVFKKVTKTYYDILRIKSGPLSKWRFGGVTADAIRENYKEYKGDFPPEVKKEAIEGIFERSSWN